MSSSLEQELCTTTPDNLESIKDDYYGAGNTDQDELELSPETTIEPTPDQATDGDPEELAPESDPLEATDADTEKQAPHCDHQELTETDPVTVPKPCIPPCKCKVPATPQPQKSRIPKAVFQYYLQFGFTPKAVEAILHSPPKDLTNKKVSFVPTTPPKNC